MDVSLNGHSTTMEVDTGASVRVMSETTFKTLFGENIALVPYKDKLQTFTGEEIEVCGQFNVTVEHNGATRELPLLIVAGDRPSLLGRNWLTELKLDWNRINLVQGRVLKDILHKYKNVFSEGLGLASGIEAKFYVDQEATPRFVKARPVPHALRDMINSELDRLENEKIIERVTHSDWAAPIVPVVKSDGKHVRICGDFKVTVNSVSKCDSYPVPRIEDLYATLSGGKTFSKLDLSNAYLQIPIHSDSKKYTTINTHRGLYQFNRLPFGISSSAGIFQRCMDNVLKDIPHVCCFLDDVFITGRIEAEHLETLDVY